jgi:hypothetical protein
LITYKLYMYTGNISEKICNFQSFIGKYIAYRLRPKKDINDFLIFLIAYYKFLHFFYFKIQIGLWIFLLVFLINMYHSSEI